MKSLLLSLMIFSMFTACQPASQDSITGNQSHPVTLQTGGYTTASFFKWMLPEARAAVSDLRFCFKRLRFKKDLTDTLDPAADDDNVDFVLGEQVISSSGALLGTVMVPEGTYYRVEFDLEPECAGNSVQLTNDFGTFVSTQRITVKFDGVFVVNGSETLELGVQNILDAANAHNSGALRDSLEAINGQL
ncbi:MAG: hypothetical protein K2P81_05530 [Bacteriovoracaceae bacterium]|nr:hypothetical protein [Bacteriovoracaceae bacterium]